MFKVFFLITVVFISFLIPNKLKAGFFQKNEKQESTQEEIKVLDNVDRLILKRQKEARELIEEGNELIKKGEKRKNQSLIVKGQIKKEIGEKQLLQLKEQEETKDIEDKENEW